MGWLMQPEHPSVREKEDLLDLSDLDSDNWKPNLLFTCEWPIANLQLEGKYTLF
jgi:hypothetical protein